MMRKMRKLQVTKKFDLHLRKRFPNQSLFRKRKLGLHKYIARKYYALRVKHVVPKREKLKKPLPANVDIHIVDPSTKFVAAQTTVEQSPARASSEEE
ncbi:hypothetical protein SESBI_08969 [Sesbania bispinosa]|nr:hypothetical protein SESBI_08969 [Sesbania bispinosa]